MEVNKDCEYKECWVRFLCVDQDESTGALLDDADGVSDRLGELCLVRDGVIGFFGGLVGSRSDGRMAWMLVLRIRGVSGYMEVAGSLLEVIRASGFSIVGRVGYGYPSVSTWIRIKESKVVIGVKPSYIE